MLLLAGIIRATGAAPSDTLKLLISIEQQTVTAPFPARVTLHLHNAGKETLWLYRRARDAQVGVEALASETTEENPNVSRGGSMLSFHLEPRGPKSIGTQPRGVVLGSVGLAHPKFVRLDPEADYEEKTTIRLEPARQDSSGGGKALWGEYGLAVTYAAKFSNSEEIERNLGVKIWEGETSSNVVEIDLEPPPGGAAGTAAGRVIGAAGQSLSEVVVSLSDKQEQLIDQLVTKSEGRFTFANLPIGLYWLTARFAAARTDTVVFRHVELTSSEPASSTDLVMLPKEAYQPKHVLHKPVLFRLTDNAGRPAGDVALEITWSDGQVMDSVKGQSSRDGLVALELIPGRNFLTLKRRGCPKEQQRADVAEGDGIDGFNFAIECSKK